MTDNITLAELTEEYFNNYIERQDYLNSFNKISFVDDSTVMIEKKYIIKKTTDESGNTAFELFNMNDYWKEDIQLSVFFNQVELHHIQDNEKYRIRMMEFSLWNNDQQVGNIKIKFGYENKEHETSRTFTQFLNCSADSIEANDFEL